jgi:hypothetical protein
MQVGWGGVDSRSRVQLQDTSRLSSVWPGVGGVYNGWEWDRGTRVGSGTEVGSGTGEQGGKGRVCG